MTSRDETGPGGRPREASGVLGWGWGRWALVLVGAATALGLITVLEAHARALTYGRDPSPLGVALRAWMPDYYLWAALTPLIVWVGRRFPLERRELVRNLGVHAVIGAAFVVVELMASCWIVSLLLADQPPPELTFWEWYFRVLARFFVWGFLLYWVVQAGAHAVRWFRQSREQELAASELEARLAGAQLRALKMQLHPHFLFNTLHSIGVLVRKNERTSALEMLSGLADLLRHSLDNVDRQEVTLKEELEFLERYLEIEQIRFRDRLRVRFEVDAGAYDAAVPNLILQPLVENAVRHGVAPSVSPRTVEIGARRRGDRLVLAVTDDGPGMPEGWDPGEAAGVGLRNVRSRLEKLYGDRAELEFVSEAGEGVSATVVLPFRRLEERGAAGRGDVPPPSSPSPPDLPWPAEGVRG